MITYIVQAGGGDEFKLLMNAQWRFDIEGMSSGKTHELAITRDPFVWRTDIPMIGVGG